MVENGVCLCTEHHGFVEEVKGRPEYDKMMVALIGQKRYALLNKLADKAKKDLLSVPKVKMPSSELDF